MRCHASTASLASWSRGPPPECRRLAPEGDIITRLPYAKCTCWGGLRRRRRSPWPPFSALGAPSLATLPSSCTQANATIVGWGATYDDSGHGQVEGVPRWPWRLRETTVPFVPNAECALTLAPTVAPALALALSPTPSPSLSLSLSLTLTLTRCAAWYGSGAILPGMLCAQQGQMSLARS